MNIGEILFKLLQAFGPEILKLVEQWQKDHDTTRLPTMDELAGDLHSVVKDILDERAEWRRTHPNA